ncbi:hypothetical protein AVEN_168596-1 [Araneus ventricosus]|uniref:Reverse transcriptase RNase H-like domain-containing protein n=1 Tax=Araneus ventricosus TaxID=182803 RepID=A0A4Y2GUY2_ARAVE|nr:hypothetical protein AVEN_168596-1 [Araneus ventricosus]
MVKAGVIEKVTEPTDWVSPLVIVQKKNGALRVCLDPQNLNRAIKRPRYNLPTFKDITSHTLSSDGIAVDKSKLEPILSMSKPEDRQSLHRYLGMINYLSKFLPNLSTLIAPLRELIKNNTVWLWDPSYDKILERQGGKPIAFASSTLTPAQYDYAHIEKELLAVVYGCKKFHQYVYGTKFKIYSDHKPLMAMSKRPLPAMSSRMQRFYLQLQSYDYEIFYKPGKEMFVSDTLSRAPLIKNHFPGSLPEEDSLVLSVLDSLPISDIKLQEISDANKSDYFNGKNYVEVVDYYSKFIEVQLISSLQATVVIPAIKSIFARHGIYP